LITAQAVIEFRRCLVQALDVKDSQLLQIPHIDQTLLRELQRGKKKANTVAEFLATPKEERKGRLSPAQQLDVEEFGIHFPDIEISAHVEVDGEDEVSAGDVAQVVITMTRKHLKEGEAQGPVHAPFFPKEKFDVWYLFLMFQFAGMASPRLLGSDRLISPERQVTSKMMFEVPPKGSYTFQLYAMSDSYAGLDVKLDVNFTVVDAVVREYKIHSDDLKLEGMSMIQQMLGMQEDEEDDDSDEDKAAKANSAEANKTAAEEKKAPANKDSDSDSSDTDSD
jgi:translocation protein SEC63